jgi:hypothetical protein
VLGVTIDTSVFAPPRVDAQRDEVYGFISTLLEWKEAMAKGHIKLYRSQFTQEVLMKCDLYPLRPRLRELLRGAQIVEYDANTIGVWIEKILKGAVELETALGITDVLAEDLAISPDVFMGHNPASLRDDSQRCAVILSLARQFAHEPMLRAHAIALRGHELGFAVRVVGLIHEIEHSRDDLKDVPLAPDRFESSVLVCSSVQHFLRCLDGIEIMGLARNVHDIKGAIQISLFQVYSSRVANFDWKNLPEFKLGRHFFQSLVDCHAMSGSGLIERLMRSVIETVCRENMSDTHALRTGSGGDNPQRSRGKDMAWRRDVDREYHLHYWECASGIVELANLVVHNDFSISD